MQSLETVPGPAARPALAAPSPQPSPAERGTSRDNNFDFLRLFAALLVIYGHGYILSTNTGPGFWGVPFARIGLDIFFCISGYMVTGSWLRTPNLLVFLQKRALRILPGLAACVLLSTYLLGARLTRLPLGQYLTNHNTFKYLGNIAFHPALYLPGVFEGLNAGGAVNGSIWSLFPEVLCYLTVPAFALLALRFRRWALGLGGILTGTLGLWLFYGYTGDAFVLYGTDVKYMLVEVPFFFIGGLYRLVDDRTPGFYRADVALLLYSLNWMVASWYGWWNEPLEWVTLPYLVICFGRGSMPVLRRAGRFGDFSYGMYLYAFPLQQVILGAMPHSEHPIVACMVLTVPFAVLSWHLVERPALRWKSRVPRLQDMEARFVLTPRDRSVPGATRRLAQRTTATLRAAAGTPLLPAAAALLCIMAYAGQLGLGRWQGDEFLLFADQRAWNWHTLETRLLFSPRPFSEGILFLYGEVVLTVGRALVVPFLTLLWAGVLGSALWAACSVLPPSRRRLAAALALTAAFFAFVLMTNSITELFYWPMAAAAYLPLGGAAIVLLFLLSHPLNRNRRLGCGAALWLAATSSEMGAALAIGFAGAAAVEAASRLAIPPRPRLSVVLREAAWWLLPGLAGLAVLAVVALVRVSGTNSGVIEFGATPDPYYTGHAAASIGAALRQVALDLLGGSQANGSAATALATKLLFAFGFAAVWRQADGAGATPGRWHMVLAVSLLSAISFSVAAAYYHYGALCCERQETARFWLIDVLAILGAAWLLARLLPSGARVGGLRRAAWLPPLLLTLSLFPVLSRIEGLRQDYRNYHLAINADKRTWRSGQRTGDNRMQFYYPPDEGGMLIRGTFQSIGTFRAGIDAPEIVSAVGRFFGKTIVDTCQPWQTDKSWLFNGQFIPACPPHAGPPDIVYTSP